MLTITSAQLDAWLAAFMFPMARIFALLSTAPIFNNAALPMRSRLIIGLAVTLAIAPLAGPLPVLPSGSWLGLLVIGQQILIGVMMGFAMRLAFVTVDIAGELIGLQMGLSFAVAYDPMAAGQTPVLTEFLGLFTALLFLAMNGHLMILAGLVESFHLLPITLEPVHTAGIAELLRWSGIIFAAGLMLALPLIAALMIANISLGVLSRIAPQLNLFAVGFPVTMAVGFLVLMFSLPYFGSALNVLFENGFRAMEQLLRASAR
jgi:flagellar biosynthetic protein FliR